MSVSTMEFLLRAIGNNLADIADLLPKEYRLTLVARNTINPKAHMIVGDDEAIGEVVHILENPKLTPVEVKGT